MAWTIEYDGGIWLPQAGWWLDSRRPAERSFVSHAHFDHMARHREVIVSPGTAALMRARLPARPSRRTEHVLPFGHEEALTEDISITLHPAGHILGSAQCLLQHPDHGRLLFTGDFNLAGSPAAEPCATPRADILIMETTFGRPKYLFPSREATLKRIGAFCREAIEADEIPLLYAYSLGKTQTLLRGLADAGIEIMLHEEAARMTAVYEQMGVSFPPYHLWDPALAAGMAVIASSQAQIDLASLGKAVRPASITGWAIDRGGFWFGQAGTSFPLSDHSGFDELLAYVDAVGPKRVYTLHGFAGDFARTLRARGIDALSLDGDNQLELSIA